MKHKRNIVRVSIPTYVLEQIITKGKETHLVCTEGLPKNAELIGQFFDTQTMEVYLICRHKSFAPVKEGNIIPQLEIKITYLPRPTREGADGMNNHRPSY